MGFQGWEHSRVTSYSRQDVLRILQISAHQLQGWERAGLIHPQQTYSFQDLGQLRTVRALREEDVPAASIRHSILAMKAVAGMENPLLEAGLFRTGTRLAFRYSGAIVDPIRRQLLFDFDRLDRLDQLERAGIAILERLRGLAPAAIEQGVGRRDARGGSGVLRTHDPDQDTNRCAGVASRQRANFGEGF